MHGFQVKSTHTSGNTPTITNNELNKMKAVSKSIPQITPYIITVDQTNNNKMVTKSLDSYIKKK